MTYTDRPQSEEPEFTNDKLDDLVLHKDDAPAVNNNNDDMNEPCDERKKAGIEQWTEDGSNNSDCWFPVHFSYSGKNYTADVQQKTGVTKEYHVSGVTPAVDHLPDPYVVAEHISKEKYDFPVNETWYPLDFGHSVIKAIEDGSNNRPLPG